MLYAESFTDLSFLLLGCPLVLSCVQALGHGSVLIHCAGGRSRSAAFITAYLMTSRGWSFDKAIATVRHARPIIQVNKGFEAQVCPPGCVDRCLSVR